MASMRCQPLPFLRTNNATSIISCTMQPSQNNIKVIINGATKDIGKAAILAVTRARGMEVAGAVDSQFIGQDAGKLKATGVVVDFTDPSTVYDNVKQAAAFGLNSIVYVPKIKLETITELSAFCEKASMGCLVAQTLSIGTVLLQQAAILASFHYNNVEIVESRPDPSELPSQEAVQIANNLSDLGQFYNREDINTDNPARGQVLGDDGVRVHSMVLPGISSSTTVHFSRAGEVYSLKHDITDIECLMPGLILAIRKVVRLKSLIYGLEKFL
ncbi:Dihydrodipicolinate reductase protein [Dioscorea alata]|uniref:Dihydrodipicolinate reductase protein n=1 Tax=Dioscorea alata TaxID=55571 RepID=A0ACB7U067_DIOAL|nr:Dihydrodipicolinate reductase protein [Dioscorea alata]